MAGNQTERELFQVDPSTVRQARPYVVPVIASGYESGELFGGRGDITVRNALLVSCIATKQQELRERGVNVEDLRERLHARSAFFERVYDREAGALQKLRGMAEEVIADWEVIHPGDKNQLVLGVSASSDGNNRITYNHRMIAVWQRIKAEQWI